MRVVCLLLLAGLPAVAQSADVEQLFREAVAAQQRGDNMTAIGKYQELIRLRPDVAELHANLGAAFAHAGRFDDAIAQYETALAKLSDNRPLQLNLALAYYKKGDVTRAAGIFETLHRSDPADVRAATLLADCYARTNRDKDAIALLTPLAASHPDDLNIAWALGSAMIHVGQRAEGLKLVVKVAEQGKSAEANFVAAGVYLAMSEFERAHMYSEAALRLDPKLKGLYSLSGRIKQYLGDFQGSKADLEKALSESPDDFEAHITMAAILNLERDVPGAKKHALRALELQPSSALARYEFARVQRSEGDIDGAVRNFEKVIQAEPDWLRPHIELAALYYKLNRAEDGQRERAIVDKMYMQGKKAGPDADR